MIDENKKDAKAVRLYYTDNQIKQLLEDQKKLKDLCCEIWCESPEEWDNGPMSHKDTIEQIRECNQAWVSLRQQRAAARASLQEQSEEFKNNPWYD